MLAGLHVGDRPARLLAHPRHVVLERAGKGLELPAEQRAPELAALRGVVGRDLEVNYLGRHCSPLVSSSGGRRGSAAVIQ